MVGEVGLEPTRPLSQQILSLSRIPIPPLARLNCKLEAPTGFEPVYAVLQTAA